VVFLTFRIQVVLVSSRVSGESNAIGRVRRASVRWRDAHATFVCFTLALEPTLTSELDFRKCLCGSYHSSLGDSKSMS